MRFLASWLIQGSQFSKRILLQDEDSSSETDDEEEESKGKKRKRNKSGSKSKKAKQGKKEKKEKKENKSKKGKRESEEQKKRRLEKEAERQRAKEQRLAAKKAEKEKEKEFKDKISGAKKATAHPSLTCGLVAGRAPGSQPAWQQAHGHPVEDGQGQQAEPWTQNVGLRPGIKSLCRESLGQGCRCYHA